MIIPISNIDQHGWIADLPQHRIPLNAWSRAVGVRFLDGCVQAREGFTQAVAPPPTTPVSIFAIYGKLFTCGPSAIYRDGTNVSRSGGYTGGADNYWLGGVFNNWLVITNGVDVPQVLDVANNSATFQNMPAWPSTYRAKVVRPFKNFLFAVGISVSGQPAGRMVKWSHPADPGTLPASWDHTNPAIDAGEVVLAEGDEDIIDLIQYYNDLFIFTSQQTWAARYTGGANMFAFSRVSSTIGLLTYECFADVPGAGLVVVTYDDIVAVTSNWQSICDGRVRRELFSNIDPTYYHRTRVFVHPTERELWIVFPERGSSVCSRAFIWNYRNNTWSSLYLDEVRAVGVQQQAAVADASIDSDTLLCDEENDLTCDSGPSILQFAKRIYLASDKAIYQNTHDVFFEADLKREDFSYSAPDKVDEYTYKRFISMRLDATGQTGAEIKVQIGAKMGVWSAETQTDTVIYRIGLSEEVQFSAVGRLFSFRLTWSDPSIRLRGVFLEIMELKQAL